MSPPRDPIPDAIAHPARRAILDALRERGELMVKELRAAVPMSRFAISQQLRILRAAGLVAFEQVGRRRRYVLTAEPMEPLLAWLSSFRRHIRDGKAMRRRARERRERRAAEITRKLLGALGRRRGR